MRKNVFCNICVLHNIKAIILKITSSSPHNNIAYAYVPVVMEYTVNMKPVIDGA